jgi:hypothetical protein
MNASGTLAVIGAGNISATQLQGIALSTTTPTTNQVLTYNGTSWAPATSTAANYWSATSTGIYYNASGGVTIGAAMPNGAASGSIAVSGNIYAGSSTAPQQLATLNAQINAQTGNTYTLQASDNGKVLTFNYASSITLTVPSGLGAGFNCLIVQLGAGTVTPTSTAATIYQRQSLTQTAGQYAVATLVAVSPDTFILSGDLQ